VQREAGSGTRSEFAATLRTYDIAETSLNIAAVEAGMGATAISELAAAAGLQSGALVRANFNLPERIFNMLAHSDRYQSRAAQAFVAMIASKS
jgi:DNA-binding transcriptional LysR family regulator